MQRTDFHQYAREVLRQTPLPSKYSGEELASDINSLFDKYVSLDFDENTKTPNLEKLFEDYVSKKTLP